MPVEFLSDKQVGAYGRFTGELSAAEVERFFYLDDADRNLIARRRSDHHRLGFAVQLGTVRAVGRFLEDPLDVPWPAVEFLAEQLEIGKQAIGGYGPLEPIARNTVNVAKIATQWPDMLRVAGSLVTNQVRAYDLLRMLGRDGHPTPLVQAFIEYDRIAKTMHLLALVDPVDGSYQRRMNRQLTVQESRHRLGRKICHGHRGQIRQAYREGQEDQLAALGLVLNAVVLWNTRYLDAIVESLRGSGQPVRDEAVARLSPLGHAHLNCLGRYAFTTQPPAELRPLRDPNARDGEDDEEF